MSVKKIVLHARLEDGYSETELNELLADALQQFDGELLEVEKHQPSCYEEDE